MDRRTLRVSLALAVTALALLQGCASAPAPSQTSPSQKAVAPAAPPAAAPSAAGESARSSGAPAPSGASAPADQAVTGAGADRRVIRNASLRLVVPDVDQTLAQLSQLAREMGGYVISSDSQEQNGERQGRSSIRVPAERLDDSLARIRGMATRVSRETTTSQDVTEEFVDQEARLRNLRVSEQQYLDLLRTARTTEDIIRVQQPLSQVREQIERIEGRLRYLERNTEMSQITMELFTTASFRPGDSGAPDFNEVFAQAMRGLMAMVVALGAILIWVLVFVPIWGPVIAFIIWRRRGVRRVPPPAPQPPAGLTLPLRSGSFWDPAGMVREDAAGRSRA